MSYNGGLFFCVLRRAIRGRRSRVALRIAAVRLIYTTHSIMIMNSLKEF